MNNNTQKFNKTILNGLLFENPTFVLMLGMCPTLAVTTSLFNALGMGLSTTIVLISSNLIISLLRNIIPDRVRIPSYIVIVASLVTVVQLLIQAFIPSLYSALGIYIPLIVVNCIILGRAESFASKNDPLTSVADGIGMGLGFTVGIGIIAIVRELIGSGSIFNIKFIPEKFNILMFSLAPGAFLVLGILCAIQNYVKIKNGKKVEELTCNNDCINCSMNKDTKGDN